MSIDAATDALLQLAADRPWRYVSLRDVAEKAGIPFAELYAQSPGKNALLARLSARYDKAALVTAETPSEDIHDRLFDATWRELKPWVPIGMP